MPRDRASLSQRSKPGFLSQRTCKLLVFEGSKPENTQESWLDAWGSGSGRVRVNVRSWLCNREVQFY